MSGAEVEQVGPGVATSDEGGGIGVVILTGEHDLSTSDAVRSTMARQIDAHEAVVVDLSRTRFLDCSIVMPSWTVGGWPNARVAG